ncbi:MAG: exosortase A [Proteobacteria bacterium]|nr:exosortase A [Pseudomonadota bacterium]
MENPTPSTAPHWRAHLLLLFVSLTGLFWIFRETAASLVSLWQSSETFAHGFIIFPISLYLIWRERAHLASITPHPSAGSLLALVILIFGWLLAQSAGVQVIAQYMFVAMISALTATLLGWRVARTIAFPLLFTLLAVPFGEILIRPLIDFTADFTVAALQLTGIPVYREGSQFTLPTGNWSVVDACSGLRYLIASFTLGCLYAYLTYRSRLRQLIFIVLSIIVPVIANGIRAYIIVLIGHLSSMKLATGVDHLIYGWLFFGFVMMLLFWLGGRWREDGQVLTTITETASIPAARPLKAFIFASVALAIAWAAPAWLRHLEHVNTTPVALTLPQTLGNWTVSPPVTGLKPVFPGAAATLLQEYRNGNQVVGIYLAFFRNQHRNAEAVTSQNRLSDEELHEWSITRESEYPLKISPGRVRQSQLAWGNQQMLAWQWYRIGDVQTANPYLAKYLQARQRLTGHGDDSLDVVIFAPYDKQPEEVAAIMERFIAQAGTALRQSDEIKK